jgi:hypothetical protein
MTVIKVLYDGKDIRVLYKSDADVKVEYNNGCIGVDKENDFLFATTSLPDPGNITIFKSGNLELEVIGVNRI